MIKFACLSCGKGLSVKDEAAGKRGKCPKCGSAVTVPSEAPAAVTPSTEEMAEGQDGTALIRVSKYALIIFAGIGVLLASLGIYRGLAEKAQEDEISQLIQSVIESANAYAAKYQYDDALKQIAEGGTNLQSYRVDTDIYKRKLEDKKRELMAAKESFTQKIASGKFVVFEGTLMPVAYRERTLAERRKAEENRRLAEEEARRLERVAEENRRIAEENRRLTIEIFERNKSQRQAEQARLEESERQAIAAKLQAEEEAQQLARERRVEREQQQQEQEAQVASLPDRVVSNINNACGVFRRIEFLGTNSYGGGGTFYIYDVDYVTQDRSIRAGTLKVLIAGNKCVEVFFNGQEWWMTGICAGRMGKNYRYPP